MIDEKGRVLGSSDMRPDASAPMDTGSSAEGAPSTAHAMPAEQPATPRASGRAATTARRATGRRPADAHVGNVLRSVYQNAVQEDIPAEMLDLLSKLD